MIDGFSGEVETVRDCIGADTRQSRTAADLRVVRGGSWINNDSANLLSSYRNNDHPTNRNDNNGFRVVVVGRSGGKATALKNRPDPGWLQWLPGQRQEVSLTRRSAPRRKQVRTEVAAVPCRGKDAEPCHGPTPPLWVGSWQILFGAAQPCACHAAHFVHPGRGMQQLTLADPASPGRVPPQDPQFFEDEVESLQRRGSFQGNSIAGFHHSFQQVQGQPIHALAERESLVLRKIRCPLQGPAQPRINQSVKQRGRRLHFRHG